MKQYIYIALVFKSEMQKLISPSLSNASSQKMNSFTEISGLNSLFDEDEHNKSKRLINPSKFLVKNKSAYLKDKKFKVIRYTSYFFLLHAFQITQL